MSDQAHFATYYNASFRDDFAQIIAALPSSHDTARETTMQPRSISLKNNVVREWPEDRRNLFAAALFLTVLADQVCFTHFPSHYSRFRELTMYPKWRGDCPGGCTSHIDPRVIFRAIGSREGRLNRDSASLPTGLPGDTLATMRREVLDFVGKYLPQIDPTDFWRCCEREIPKGV